MIYICIPALDEARTVGVLLWRIRRVMEEFPRDYHVLVLDDGSTDDTPEVLAPYARVLPLTLLRNERTQGYAAALERLLREAAQRSTHPKRDVVVTMQADFTESPDDLPNLIRKMEGGADVVGTTVAGVDVELPRAHRWSRRGLPWLLSRAPLAKELGDPLSGFRAYRAQVIRRALQDREGKPLVTGSGWAANAELLLAVAPHVRRGEGIEVSLRYGRRERPTRFRAWGTAVDLWNLARRAPRRLAVPSAEPPGPAPSAAAPAAPAAIAGPAAQAEAGDRPPRPRRERRKRPKPPRETPAEPAVAAAAPPEEAPSGDAPAPKPKRRRSRSRRPRGDRPRSPEGEE
ncbi:MAG TPA: glycosyltransferase family 2 protein [Longimicrobium sp.]|nr:glycosyltransferase family 2 protein [Longimicrobium sp.]